MNRTLYLLTLLFACFAGTVQARVIHVSTTMGSDANEGTEKAPYATISKATYHALAGDTVIVHEGTYREWVSPANAGINSRRRIVYMAHPGDKVVLKGSERIDNWKKVDRNIWKTVIDNTLFGDFNPYATHLTGDWMNTGHDLHLGEVFLNEKALREVTALDSLQRNSWFVQVGKETTVIYAHFDQANPNKELTEINVRPACFFPKTTGMNYITVKGFHMMQAATQWSAPTSEQVGLIGPNWSKGWVIEDCEISLSKCVGICLGKDRASGHNMWSLYKNKFGYMKCGFNREIEVILKAIDLGWNKENIGSHVIRRNVIHDCGQAGIVGHLGGAFCTITDNEIYNINLTEGNPTGAETGGIKLHAAIDTRIERNFIHKCVRGIWLDWQTQGTQVCRNIFIENKLHDLFVEVSHGPAMFYNNLFLSQQNLEIKSQGMAFFNNIFAGCIHLTNSPERYTPYHVAHSTKVKGFFENTGGDMRFYNNLFLGAGTTKKIIPGLSVYDNYPEYDEHMTDSVKYTPQYLVVRFPVWAAGNVYFKDAEPYKFEKNPLTLDQTTGHFTLVEEKDGWYFDMSCPNQALSAMKTYPVSTESLGQTMISEEIYENPDGTPFVLKTDFFGKAMQADQPVVGPFGNYAKQMIWRK